MAGIGDAIDYVGSIFSGLMTNLIAAVIIFLIGLIVGKVLGKVTYKVLHELEVDRIVKKTARIKFSLEKMIGRFVSYFIYFVAAIIALNQFGLTTTILHMISAAVLIVIVISIVLGVKDFIPNFLAGIQIYRKEMVKEGDFIRVRGNEGEVASIDITEIKLKTEKGDMLYIPNSILIKEDFTKLRRKKKR